MLFRSVEIMKGAMGLNQDQADTIHYLETGQGIVRTGGGVFIEPCPAMFHEFEKPGGVSIDDFYNHQQVMKQRLYKESGVVAGEDLKWKLLGMGNKQNDVSENEIEEEFDVLT